MNYSAFDKKLTAFAKERTGHSGIQTLSIAATEMAITAVIYDKHHHMERVWIYCRITKKFSEAFCARRPQPVSCACCQKDISRLSQHENRDGYTVCHTCYAAEQSVTHEPKDEAVDPDDYEECIDCGIELEEWENTRCEACACSR